MSEFPLLSTTWLDEGCRDLPPNNGGDRTHLFVNAKNWMLRGTQDVFLGVETRDQHAASIPMRIAMCPRRSSNDLTELGGEYRYNARLSRYVTYKVCLYKFVEIEDAQ